MCLHHVFSLFFYIVCLLNHNVFISTVFKDQNLFYDFTPLESSYREPCCDLHCINILFVFHLEDFRVKIWRNRLTHFYLWSHSLAAVPQHFVANIGLQGHRMQPPIGCIEQKSSRSINSNWWKSFFRGRLY